MRALRPAFTLFEVLMVALLIGVAATFFLSRAFRPSPAGDWKSVLYEVNNIVSFARQEAITQQQVHRLVFAQKAGSPAEVWIELERDDPEKPGHKRYQKLAASYAATSYTFPPEFVLQAVLLGKKEMLAENKGQAYCYIVPEGLVQQVTVRLVKKMAKNGLSYEASAKYELSESFVMDPFFGTFSLQTSSQLV